MKLRPLYNKFIFKFEDENNGKTFENVSEFGLILKEADNDIKNARWGIVESVGPDVTGFKAGSVVLIEPLMWTNKIELEGQAPIWSSDETKVLAIK